MARITEHSLRRAWFIQDGQVRTFLLCVRNGSELDAPPTRPRGARPHTTSETHILGPSPDYIIRTLLAYGDITSVAIDCWNDGWLTIRMTVAHDSFDHGVPVVLINRLRMLAGEQPTSVNRLVSDVGLPPTTHLTDVTLNGAKLADYIDRVLLATFHRALARELEPA